MGLRGCIRKRGGSWEWRTRTPDGRHVSKAGFQLKKDAEDALAKAIAAMADQRFVRPDRLTVTDYLTQIWLPAMKPTVAYTTYVNYESVVKNHLALRIGDIPLQKLSTGHIKTMYAELSQSGHCQSTKDEPKGLSPKSIRNVHTTLHRALNDAGEGDTSPPTWPRGQSRPN